MKRKRKQRARRKRDTMRREYDFSLAIRGETAARYAQGGNVVVVAAREKP
ncbi:MAG: hypothetical protein L0Z50_37210 [Verrucomicrobiales bacterium]|nr:hypothetical protein [Verrucomicrobiales bacterium]